MQAAKKVVNGNVVTHLATICFKNFLTVSNAQKAMGKFGKCEKSERIILNGRFRHAKGTSAVLKLGVKGPKCAANNREVILKVFPLFKSTWSTAATPGCSL